MLPGKVFSPPGSGTDYRIDPKSHAHIGAFVCGKGSLEGWQETVAKPARKSSCLRVAIAAAFAAPLLRPMAMDSFAINWFSTTSDGKTAMLFIAASVAGLIGPDGLPGWAELRAGNRGSGPRSPRLRSAAGRIRRRQRQDFAERQGKDAGIHDRQKSPSKAFEEVRARQRAPRSGISNYCPELQ